MSEATNTEELTVEQIYVRVAKQYAAHINQIFSSEETLKAVYESYFQHLPFDRTERWNHILRQELFKIWFEYGLAVKGKPTDYDTWQIILALQHELDYNLFTQVLLNIQPWRALRYKRAEVEPVITALKAKWEGKTPSPFDAKPKMIKGAATQEQVEFNHDLSTLKALNIISKSHAGIHQSYRVTPKGSTPALVDSDNISMLGVGADQYLEVPPGFRAYYFTWEAAPEWMKFEDGKFRDPSIAYPFESKSGGDILNAAMFARFVATVLFNILAEDGKMLLLPRMNSVLMITNIDLESVVMATNFLRKDNPFIQFHEGTRGEKEV